MARITHVQSARERRDSDGNIKPPHVCELNSDHVIKPGMPYKWVGLKTGPRTSIKRIRCADCPDWQVWDMSNSLAAQLARISHTFQESLDDVQTEDDVQAALDTTAEEIQEIAEAKREAAQNIEDGFGHETEQSAELTDIADQLDSWADEISGASFSDYPEPEEDDCEDCDGTGRVDADSRDVISDLDENGQVECDTCSGGGQYTPEEPTDEQIDEWRDTVRDELSGVVDEAPV